MKNGSESPDNKEEVKIKPPEQHKDQAAAAAAAGAVPWVPMQYPPPSMIMQPHHFIPPPYPAHYMPFYQDHHHQPFSPARQTGGSNSENRTIWVGDLHHWMDEDYLRSCFASNREVASLKVIRNKQTGLSEGYGFIEFLSHAAAEKVLQAYSCIVMPNTDQLFRLNWATCSTGEKHSNSVPDLSIFVGDLAADVTDTLLLDTFSSKYPSVKAAKVVIDAHTGRSKGYGFVRFGDDSERSHAMTEMNGAYCSSRPMRIAAATPRKSSGYQLQRVPQGGYENGSPARGSQSDEDTTNTTIFVGGLDPNVGDEDLRQPFLQYGEVVSVKIPAGKGCGFVQFANRNDAVEALEKTRDLVIGKRTVRLSWGRNPVSRQSRPDFVNNPWTSPYYGGHFYGGGYGYGYGYGFPAVRPDPSMYTSTPYAAYPMYGPPRRPRVMCGFMLPLK
ncbi:unnamed protein product [Cuscuta europaea]|nr:unnamed protein product [Cuscuta europaea]